MVDIESNVYDEYLNLKSSKLSEENKITNTCYFIIKVSKHAKFDNTIDWNIILRNILLLYLNIENESMCIFD